MAMPVYVAEWERRRSTWVEWVRAQADPAPTFRTSTREATMGSSTVKMRAPDNPYRVEWAGTDLSREFPHPEGPGLLVADLERIARHHFVLGRSEAEAESSRLLSEMREQLAGAYDDGFAAGRIERARGLARDFRTKLLSVHFGLRQIEETPTAPRVKRTQWLEFLRRDVNAVLDFAETMGAAPDAHVLRGANDDEMVAGS